MGEIRSHKCPSCGGNLIIDNEKQMYRCTSCGSSYDFDYFREERFPNTPRIFDVIRDGEDVIIIEEHINGRTLEDMLKEVEKAE